MTEPKHTDSPQALPPLKLSARITYRGRCFSTIVISIESREVGSLTLQSKHAPEIVALLNGGLDVLTAGQALIAATYDPNIGNDVGADLLVKFRSALAGATP